VIRILVTEEAFKAIEATMPVGAVAFEPEITSGLRQIWQGPAVMDKLARLRGPGETSSAYRHCFVGAGQLCGRAGR
jgi:hypothetical protein